MACIGYPYVAASQDLWLYTPRVINWTVPSAGSASIDFPSAWNPGSPLYGYRGSLQGITIRCRTQSADALTYLGGTSYAYYSTFNNPALPQNKWAFYNSYPMPVYMLGAKLGWTCAHCVASGSVVERDPAVTWDSVHGPGSLNYYLQVFEWMNKDNVIDNVRSPSQMLKGYTRDTPTDLYAGTDLLIVESVTPLTVEPIQVVDLRTLSPGSTVWELDSAMKIIRHKLVGASVYSQVGLTSQAVPNIPMGHVALQAVTPDGLTNVLIGHYLHDSGSVLFAEISPPTSAAAGDGVLGLVPAHMYTGGDFTSGNKQLYSEYTSFGRMGSGTPATRMINYAALKGDSFEAQPAKRQHTDFALQSTMDTILQKSLDILGI